MALSKLARIAKGRDGYVANSLFSLVLLGTTMFALLGTTSRMALAQDGQAASSGQAQSFSIPAQPLPAAISAFIKQSGWQVGYSSSIAQGLTSQAVSGTMPPEQALRTLLSGTGISVSLTGPSTATLMADTGEGATVEGAIALDTINVSGGANDRNASSGSGFQGTPDWVYETPASVSVVSREAVQKSGVRDTRDLMANVAGVYSGQGNGSFPTVSPNIRGLQDSGRVVISIDGARQNAQRGVGTGSSGYQANSGQAYVDPAFVRMVEIDKNPDASAGNAASLGGSVNFRTVGSEDLIDPGNEWGMEMDLMSGDNEYDFRGSLLVSARLADTPFSLTGGVSRHELGEYMVGQNNASGASSGTFRGREGHSTFLKLEGDFDAVQTSLSWMHQSVEFKYLTAAYPNYEEAHVDTATAKLSWNPEDELIDFNANLWLNTSQINERREERVRTGVTTEPETYIDSELLTFGATLQNTSRLATPLGGLKLNYGVEGFRDDGTASAMSDSIAEEPRFASTYLAFSPPGNRDVASGFLNGEWKPQDWVTVSGGLRYDWSRLKGTPTYYNVTTTTIDTTRYAQAVTTRGEWAQVYDPVRYDRDYNWCHNPDPNDPRSADRQQPACDRLAQTGEIVNGGWYPTGTFISGGVETVTEYPAYTLDIDRTDAALLPSATVEFKPFDWLRPYASYSQSFRPPTITEAFFAGGAPGDFIGIAYAPNIYLRPERAETFEIGANVSLDGVVMEDDRLRLKAAAFKRDVDDYVVLGHIITQEVPDRNNYLSFVNLDGITKMRGLEFEGNYDARFFWIGGALSLIETEWPQKTQVFSNGTTTTSGEIFAVAGNVPPEFKLTLDGGVRLFDEKLEIGARYNRVKATLSRTLDDNGNLVEHSPAYRTVDIYGALHITEHTTLRYMVTNATDQNYVPATGSYTAPGRTATVGLNLQF